MYILIYFGLYFTYTINIYKHLIWSRIWHYTVNMIMFTTGHHKFMQQHTAISFCWQHKSFKKDQEKNMLNC